MDATQYKQAILQTLDAIGGEVTACADAIHGYAELSGEEHRSAAALEELLEHHGLPGGVRQRAGAHRLYV